MKISLKVLCRWVCAVTAVLAGVSAQAQANYPVREVKLVAGFAAGGATDVIARYYAKKLSDKLGQAFIVENRPGGGGIVSLNALAQSTPDGYTLALGSNPIASNAVLNRNPYDWRRDLAPIAMLVSTPNVLVVPGSSPINSVNDLIEAAKKSPGILTFASAGNGVGGHLSGELFKMLARIDMLHIPYKGIQPAMIDVVGGQVTMTFASIASGMPQVIGKRLLPLAVTGAQRSPAAKDLPTMIEAGIKGYESSTWYGLVAPAGTPADIINRLNSEVVAALKSPDLNERLSREGADPVGNSPAEFARYIQSEIDKWRKVIRAAGIEPS